VHGVAVADRTQEHLGESDRGVIMMRRRLLDDIEVIAQGGEPKAMVRDPELNRCIRLPIIDRERFVNGFPREELRGPRRSGTPGPVVPEGFPFLAGQPEEVRTAFRKAMGLDVERAREVR